MITEYILQIFPLVCIAIVMVLIALQNRNQDRFMSNCFGAIVGMTLASAIVVVMTLEGERFGNVALATVGAFLGYAIRPFCLYVFILLATRRFGKWEKIALIPLCLNVLIYASSVCFFYEPLAHLTFYYIPMETGSLEHVRGPLNLTSHILSALYLCWLVYLSIRRLRGKHRADAISILICATFVVAAVCIEMTGYGMGILNLTIGISSIFYYIFLLSEANRRDALTRLFDRKTYYADLKRFGHAVTGVIAIDMNGLKAINDTQGHEGGDEALSHIGACIEKAVCRRDNMYVYRIGGDEFTILCVKADEALLSSTASAIRESVAEKGYSVSIGYAFRASTLVPIDETIASADEAMYLDKARYYQTHTEIDRRRGRK